MSASLLTNFTIIKHELRNNITLQLNIHSINSSWNYLQPIIDWLNGHIDDQSLENELSNNSDMCEFICNWDDLPFIIKRFRSLKPLARLLTNYYKEYYDDDCTETETIFDIIKRIYIKGV